MKTSQALRYVQKAKDVECHQAILETLLGAFTQALAELQDPESQLSFKCLLRMHEKLCQISLQANSSSWFSSRETQSRRDVN